VETMQNTTGNNVAADNDGLRKAAVLVATLDPLHADKLLEQLPESVARQIRAMACQLIDVDQSEERRTIQDFLGGAAPQSPQSHTEDDSVSFELSGRTSDLQPMTTNMPEEIAPRSKVSHNPQPEQSESLLPETLSDKPFDFLCDVDMRRLVDVLENERPNIIAIILSQLPREESLRILSGLRPLIQSQVVRCMLETTPVDPIVLSDVEAVLRERLHRDIAIGSSAERTDVESLAEMFRSSEGRAILENLSAYDPTLAEQLGRRLESTPSGRSIEFDDLGSFGGDSLSIVFRAAAKEEVVLSLIDAPAPLVRRVLRSLPTRDARLIERALDQPGPLRLSDIDQARERIAELARRMIREGRIDPPKFKTPSLDTVFA